MFYVQLEIRVFGPSRSWFCEIGRFDMDGMGWRCTVAWDVEAG
jgi:hypothetical protein